LAVLGLVRRRIVREQHFHFDQEILALGDDVYLDGYWQSPKYFSEVDHVIRGEFKVRDPLVGKNLEFAKRIEDWKTRGYLIEIVYLRLASPQLALRRIASRVRQGGHNVPRADVLRRFKRGWTNFLDVYQPLADHWAIYENSESKPKLLERGP